ncbi:MAG TPA: HAMP domain-containing sensor histidine kinase [Rhizomicrobium sp.]|nr:HAMP domain-containing sensor histidine kinase [Rhizomicrobium sp.]
MGPPAANRTTSEEPNYELDTIRLVFRDSSIERIFEREMLQSSLGIIRIYVLAGTLLYAAFGILDRIAGGSVFPILLLIRFGFAIPVLMAGFILTFSPVFARIGQYMLGAILVASGSGVVIMTMVMHSPFNAEYYAGVVMCVIYSSSLIRLRFTYAAIISAFLVCIYQISAVAVNPIPVDTYISNNFFLIMATGVGLFSGYYQELYVRKSYVSQKIIEAKNVTLNALLAEADNANKSKGEFLATMSHELRTPLNAIIGFSDVLHKQLYGSLGNARYLEYVADINSSGLHLLAIINDILDLAKAEAGKLELREDVFDLVSCLQACMQMCAGRADEGGIVLELATAEPDIEIHADERLIRQLALNLISNGVKFTPPGGRVDVRAGPNEHGELVIEVTDTGIGIPTEHLERVLRPFEQVERALCRRHGGTGLGLPFAKKIAELHGGALTLESKVDCGTHVTVQLPASRLVPQQRKQPAKQAV